MFTVEYDNGTTSHGALPIVGSYASFQTASTDLIFISSTSPVLVAQFAKV
jgi:hypothetical protein